MTTGEKGLFGLKETDRLSVMSVSCKISLGLLFLKAASCSIGGKISDWSPPAMGVKGIVSLIS